MVLGVLKRTVAHSSSYPLGEGSSESPISQSLGIGYGVTLPRPLGWSCTQSGKHRRRPAEVFLEAIWEEETKNLKLDQDGNPDWDKVTAWIRSEEGARREVP